MSTPNQETTTLERLIAEVELKRIAFFEVSARRWNSDPEKSEEPQGDAKTVLKVMQKVDSDSISIRCRLTLHHEEGIVVADGAAIFEERNQSPDATEIGLSEAILVEFSRQVGIPTMFPYLREAIQESARKLRMKAPVLGLLRPESLKLEQRDDDDADSA